MSFSDTVLSGLDGDTLYSTGRMRESSEEGSLLIHLRCLNPASNKEHHDLQLPVASDRFGPWSPNNFTTIPVAFNSVETLLYLGMTRDRANLLWTEWAFSSLYESTEEGMQRPRHTPLPSLVEYAKSNLVGKPCDDVDSRHDDEEWVECLHNSYIGQDLIDAIMHPSHRGMRLTNSCYHWIRDTVDMRCRALEEIHRTSKLRAEAAYPHQLNPDIPLAGAGYRQPVFADTTWTPEAVRDLKRNDPDRIVLFKVVDQAQLFHFWSRDCTDRDEHSVEKLLGPPLTTNGGDNDDDERKFYFTDSVRTAEAQAAYAKIRGGRGCSVVIVALTLPTSAIWRLQHTDCGASVERLDWGEPAWKLFVWLTKIGLQLPPPLRKYRDATLLIRTMAQGGPYLYRSLLEEQLVAEKLLYMVEPGDRTRRRPQAKEYVFAGSDAGLAFLRVHGTFEVYPVSDANVAVMGSTPPVDVVSQDGAQQAEGSNIP